MALAVDAAGKVKATPTGKITGRKRANEGGGAAALREALGSNALQPVAKQSLPGEEPVANQLERGRAATPQRTRQASQPQVSWSPSGPVTSSPAPGLSGYQGMSAKATQKVDLPKRRDWSDTNSSYEDYFRQAGMSDDDINGMTSRQTQAEFKPNASSPQDLVDVATIGNPVDTFTSIDDGTLDYNHLASDTMTGTQYLKYSELGMGGRPVQEIDPTKTYSKHAEMSEYDFSPYVPDSTAAIDMLIDDLVDKPAQWGSVISNSRTNGNPLSDFFNNLAGHPNDYTIHVGDQDYSGLDFDKLSPAYMHQLDYYSQFQPERFLTPPADGSSYTAILNEAMIPDMDGNETYHYGSMLDIVPASYAITFDDGTIAHVSSDYIDSITYVDGNGDQYWSQPSGPIPTVDGGYVTPAGMANDIMQVSSLVTFSDGSSVETPVWPGDDGGVYIDTPQVMEVTDKTAHGQLPADLSSLNDVSTILSEAQQDGVSPLRYANVVFVPDLVMSDGSSISRDDVYRMYHDDDASNDPEDESDDDISYTFGPDAVLPFGILGRTTPMWGFDNRPRRLMNQEVFTEDGPNFDDIGNNILDWTMGSIPISLPGVIPWVQSASSATSSAHGIDPQSYSPVTNSYNLIAGNYDDEGNLRYGNQSTTDATKWWNALGTTIVPLTENLAGNVGSDPMKKGIEMALGRSLLPDNPTFWQVLGNAVVDAGGESLEEIIGNPVEEGTQYGFGQNFYANQMADDEGHPMYDLYNEIRDPNTTWRDRVGNAVDLNDTLNAAIGGAGVSALMNPLLPVELAKGAVRDNARRRSGVGSQFIEAHDSDRQVSEDYLRNFSDRFRGE